MNFFLSIKNNVLLYVLNTNHHFGYYPNYLAAIHYHQLQIRLQAIQSKLRTVYFFYAFHNFFYTSRNVCVCFCKFNELDLYLIFHVLLLLLRLLWYDFINLKIKIQNKKKILSSFLLCFCSCVVAFFFVFTNLFHTRIYNMHANKKTKHINY